MQGLRWGISILKCEDSSFLLWWGLIILIIFWFLYYNIYLIFQSHLLLSYVILINHRLIRLIKSSIWNFTISRYLELRKISRLIIYWYLNIRISLHWWRSGWSFKCKVRLLDWKFLTRPWRLKRNTAYGLLFHLYRIFFILRIRSC